MKSTKLILLSTIFTLASCSSEGITKSKASEAGKADAENFINTSYTEMQLQNALLEIRSTEHKMREAGYNSAADAYIEAFETTVKERSDSISRIIF